MSTALEDVTKLLHDEEELTDDEKTMVSEAVQALSEKALTFLRQVFQNDPEFVSVFAKNLLAKKDAFAKEDNELFETVLDTQQAECN